MLQLPDITVVCIDTQNHALAIYALLSSIKNIQFGAVKFLTDREFIEKNITAPGVQYIEIKPILNSRAYSQYVLKSLLPHVLTPYVLVVQYDGFVINADAWNSEFLNTDYIGAPWHWHKEGRRVGNGGFSLRSRKLLEILEDKSFHLHTSEDTTICHEYRNRLIYKYGIKFASEELANDFSFETELRAEKTFGFHGLFNFPMVVPPRQLVSLLDHMVPEIIASEQYESLIHNCLALELKDLAKKLISKVIEIQPDNGGAIELLRKI